MYIDFKKHRCFRNRFVCRATCCRCGGTGRMFDGSICYHCRVLDLSRTNTQEATYER